MDLSEVMTLVLGSSAIGAGMSSAVNWFLQRRNRKRYNSFIALTLSHDFEKYAHSCLSRINDNELHMSTEGLAGSWDGAPPKPFDLPEEDYRNFDIKLLDSIFEFPQKILFATKEISFINTVADDDTAYVTFRKYTTELGNHALSIADRLRDKYGLPYKKLRVGNFDLREELKNKMQ